MQASIQQSVTDVTASQTDWNHMYGPEYYKDLGLDRMDFCILRLLLFLFLTLEKQFGLHCEYTHV